MDENTNIFMRNHWDIEYAIEKGKEYLLDEEIVI
jgi:hypothetical protein